MFEDMDYWKYGWEGVVLAYLVAVYTLSGEIVGIERFLKNCDLLCSALLIRDALPAPLCKMFVICGNGLEAVIKSCLLCGLRCR